MRPVRVRNIPSWRWLPIVSYLVVVAALTLSSRRGTSGALAPNWMPLSSIADLVSGPARRATVLNNLLGNALLLAPLAVLLRVLVLRSAGWTLATVAATSGIVELLQGLGVPDGRQANIDDLLLNVAGAAAALLLLRLGRGPTNH